MERDGAAVTCDGRLFHRRAAVTGNALSPTVDRRVCRTSRDVDEAERIVVVWIQYLLVDVVHHTGTLAADHVDIFVRQNCDLYLIKLLHQNLMRCLWKFLHKLARNRAVFYSAKETCTHKNTCARIHVRRASVLCKSTCKSF